MLTLGLTSLHNVCPLTVSTLRLVLILADTVKVGRFPELTDSIHWGHYCIWMSTSVMVLEAGREGLGNIPNIIEIIKMMLRPQCSYTITCVNTDINLSLPALDRIKIQKTFWIPSKQLNIIEMY